MSCWSVRKLVVLSLAERVCDNWKEIQMKKRNKGDEEKADWKKCCEVGWYSIAL